MKGFESLDLSYLKLEQYDFTCINGCKLVGKHFMLNEGKYFLFIRIVNMWSDVQTPEVKRNITNTFRNRLDDNLLQGDD